MDRPHIIYCARTGKYVAWLKIMADEVSQFFSVMTADRFEGPYTFIHKVYKPLKMDSGDFCLHVDAKTQKAYIWFERPHFQMICATLTEDYTEVTGEYSVHYDSLIPPLTREAPTYFERKGKNICLHPEHPLIFLIPAACVCLRIITENIRSWEILVPGTRAIPPLTPRLPVSCRFPAQSGISHAPTDGIHSGG